MYPAKELTKLAAHKVVLRRDIALRRVQCRAAAATLGRPVAWLDRMVALWRKVSPLARLAALPVAFGVMRLILPRTKFLRSVLRWGPLAFGAVRAISSVVAPARPPRRGSRS